MSKQVAFLGNTIGALDRGSVSACSSDSNSHHAVITKIFRQNGTSEALDREFYPSSEDLRHHTPVKQAVDMARCLASAPVGGRSIAVLEAEAAVAAAVRMRLALKEDRARKESTAIQQQQQDQKKDQYKRQQHQALGKEVLPQLSEPSTEQSCLWSTQVLPGATDFHSGPLPSITDTVRTAKSTQHLHLLPDLPSVQTQSHQTSSSSSDIDSSNDSSNYSSNTTIALPDQPGLLSSIVMRPGSLPGYTNSPSPHPSLPVYHQHPDPHGDGTKSAKRTRRCSADTLASARDSLEGGAGFSHLDDDDVGFLAPGDGIAFAPDHVSWSALSQDTLTTGVSYDSLSQHHTQEYTSLANVISVLPRGRSRRVGRQSSDAGGGSRREESDDEGGVDRVLNYGSSGESEDGKLKIERKQQEGQQEQDEKHMGSFETGTRMGMMGSGARGGRGNERRNDSGGGSGSGGGGRSDRQTGSHGGISSSGGKEGTDIDGSSGGDVRGNTDGSAGGRGGSGPGKGPATACSRAVERYGTLLQSSPSWRCTEMYDIHDSLLLANLSVCRTTAAPHSQRRILLLQQSQRQPQQQHPQRLSVSLARAASPAAAAAQSRFSNVGYSAPLTPVLMVGPPAEGGEDGVADAEEMGPGRGLCVLHNAPSDPSAVLPTSRGSLLGTASVGCMAPRVQPSASGSISNKLFKYGAPQPAPPASSPLKSTTRASTEREQLLGPQLPLSQGITSGQRRNVLAATAMHLFRPVLRFSTSGGIGNNNTNSDNNNNTSINNNNNNHNNNNNGHNSREHSGGGGGGGRRSLVLDSAAVSGISSTDLLSAVLQNDDAEEEEQPRGPASMQHHSHLRWRASTSTGISNLSNGFSGVGISGGSGSGVNGWGAVLEELRESVTAGASLGSRLRPSPSARAFTAKTTMGVMAAGPVVASGGSNMGTTLAAAGSSLRPCSLLGSVDMQRATATGSFDVKSRRGHLTEVGVRGGYAAAPLVLPRASLPMPTSADSPVRGNDRRDTAEPAMQLRQHLHHHASWSELQQTQPIPQTQPLRHVQSMPQTKSMPQVQILSQTQPQLQPQQPQPQLMDHDANKMPDRWAFVRTSSGALSLSLPHPPSHPRSLLLLGPDENCDNSPHGSTSCPVSPARRRTTASAVAITTCNSSSAAAATDTGYGSRHHDSTATTATFCDSPPVSQFPRGPSLAPSPLRSIQGSALSYSAALGPSTLGSSTSTDSDPFSSVSASPFMSASTSTAAQIPTAGTPYALRSYSCSQTAWSRAGQTGLKGGSLGAVAAPVARVRPPKRLPSRLSQQGLPQYHQFGRRSTSQSVIMSPAVPVVPEITSVNEDVGGNAAFAVAIFSSGVGSGVGSSGSGRCGGVEREDLDSGSGSLGFRKGRTPHSLEEHRTPSLTTGLRSAAALAQRSLRNFLTRNNSESEAMRASKVSPLCAPNQAIAGDDYNDYDCTAVTPKAVSPEVRKASSYVGYRSALTLMAEADSDMAPVSASVLAGSSMEVQVVRSVESVASAKVMKSVHARGKSETSNRGPEKLHVRRLLRTLFGIRRQSRVAVVTDATEPVERPAVTEYDNPSRATSDDHMYSQDLPSPGPEKLCKVNDTINTPTACTSFQGGDNSRPCVPTESTAATCRVEILRIAGSARACHPQQRPSDPPKQQATAIPEVRSAEIQFATVSRCSIPDLQLCASPQPASSTISTGNPSIRVGSQSSPDVGMDSASAGPSSMPPGRDSNSPGHHFINPSGDATGPSAHVDLCPSLESPSPSTGQFFDPSPTTAQAAQTQSPRLTKREWAAREAHLRWIAPLAAAVLSPEPATPQKKSSERRSRSSSKSRRRG